MTFTIPRPSLIRPQVPGLVTIGLLAAQFLILNITNDANPHCKLIVQRPHISTDLAERQATDAIKLNITSKCNVSQRFTELEAWIEIDELNTKSVAHSFGMVRAIALRNNEKEARFENLYVVCKKNVRSLYKGFAKGFVTLTSGEKFPVEGDSKEFLDAKCRMGAK